MSFDTVTGRRGWHRNKYNMLMDRHILPVQQGSPLSNPSFTRNGSPKSSDGEEVKFADSCLILQVFIVVGVQPEMCCN